MDISIGNKPKSSHLPHIKPTQAIALGFLAMIFLGAILLSLPIATKEGKNTPFIDALFTSTSASCVTGFLVYDSYNHFTLFGQLVILFLVQIGGLGFMTMATMFSFILRRRISLGERLLIAESLNQFSLKGILRLVRRILFGTLIFEGLGAFILALRFSKDMGLALGIYSGIFHSITAFCNAGFDIMGHMGDFVSLSPYKSDLLVTLTISSLIILGGLGFAVWDNIYRKRSFKRLHIHAKLVLAVTAVLILAGAFLFFVLEYKNPETLAPLPLDEKLLVSLFSSVSSRTAGFSTINMAKINNSTIFILMILMFIGGSPGSTAGGIKTTTAGVLIFSALAVVKGRQDTRLFKRRISGDYVARAFTISLIAIMVVALGTLVLTIFETLSLSEAMFEAISAFATVGYSLGVTTQLQIAGKLTLIVMMFVGRVGVLTIALGLFSKTQSKQLSYRYKEEKLMVG